MPGGYGLHGLYDAGIGGQVLVIEPGQACGENRLGRDPMSW